MGMIRGTGQPRPSPTRISPPARCEHCGAPGQPRRCHYCHTMRTESLELTPTIHGYVDSLERLAQQAT